MKRLFILFLFLTFGRLTVDVEALFQQKMGPYCFYVASGALYIHTLDSTEKPLFRSIIHNFSHLLSTSPSTKITPLNLPESLSPLSLFPGFVLLHCSPPHLLQSFTVLTPSSAF